jgi:hypothetical protein
MGIIVEISCKQVEVSYLMGCENAHMWHDCMCQSHTLVATLIAKLLLIRSCIYTNCNVIVTHN